MLLAANFGLDGIDYVLPFSIYLVTKKVQNLSIHDRHAINNIKTFCKLLKNI